MPDHNVELYEHQEQFVAAVMERENCLVRSGTGSGKSTAALALAARLKLPTLVIVNNAGLFKQWRERVRKELGFEPGEIRGAKCELRVLTIAMQQTLAAHSDPYVHGYFGAVIGDEVQIFAARTCFEAVDPFAARYRVGMSADERRADRKEFLIHDLFGEVVADVDKEGLIASGHVLDVEVRVLPTTFEAPWYRFGATANPRDDLDFDRLLNEMSASDARNEVVMEAVSEELEAGGQVLVMSHRREHCLELAEQIIGMGVKVGRLIGGADYANEFERTRAGMLSGDVRVGVGTYQAIGQGIDLPRVAAVVAATPIAGNKQFFGQVRGRVCRTASGKATARLWYPLDVRVYSKHLANLRKWNNRVLVLEEGKWHDAKSWRPGA